MKTAFVRLLAIALMVAGWIGTQLWSIERIYSARTSFTLSTAKADELDALFSEASRGHFEARIERDKTSSGLLEVNFEGSSWIEVNQSQDQFSNRLGKAALARKLRITATNSYSNSYRSRSGSEKRLWFLVSVATAVLGTATLILSLRIFGGGKREESPLAVNA